MFPEVSFTKINHKKKTSTAIARLPPLAARLILIGECTFVVHSTRGLLLNLRAEARRRMHEPQEVWTLIRPRLLRWAQPRTARHSRTAAAQRRAHGAAVINFDARKGGQRPPFRASKIYKITSRFISNDTF